MRESLYIEPSTIVNLLGTVGSPLIVISELIKNAIDACADNINIFYNRKSKSISIVDDGYGFSLDDIHQLSKPGFSNKKACGNLTNAKGAFYTGSKGLGLLSVFSLCDHLTIQTKSDIDGEYVINWVKDVESYDYEQVIPSQMNRGTVITLNEVYPQVMSLLTSESEIKKLRHISTYLYKYDSLPFPNINLSIDNDAPSSLLFSTKLMLYDVTFYFDSKTERLSFQCLSDNTNINSDTIVIDSFDTNQIEGVLNQYYGIKETIRPRTNDNINFKDLEGVNGIPTFEGRLLVFEKKTAGGMLKDHGAGVNIYVNDFALYNYLSEELDWLGLADFSQRKKATRLKPHNVFGFVNMPNFDETQEQLKISNERADFIQDPGFIKFLYIIKGVIMFMILNIDVAEKNPKYKRNENLSGNNNIKDEQQDNRQSNSNGSTSANEHEKEDDNVKDEQQDNRQNNSNGSTSANEYEKDDNVEDEQQDNKNNLNDSSSAKENEEDNDNSTNEDDSYEPESNFKPPVSRKKKLFFTLSEGVYIDKLKNTDDLSNKIYQTILELSKLNVLYYQYATVCLYRTLIESATQYASARLDSIYQENALPTSICNVLNKWSNINNTSKEFKSNIGLWRDLVNKRNLTEKLNLYIHNVTPIDINLIFDTWKSMKGYIYQCIRCDD